jgi:hypothetical protein
MNPKILTAVALLIAGTTEIISGDPPSAVAPLGFPVPPGSDADPSVRHAVSAEVPTQLKAQRAADHVTVALAAFKSMNVTIGKNLVGGLIIVTRIYRAGRPPPAQNAGYALESGLDFRGLDSSAYKIPSDQRPSVVEKKLTLFETDEPSQHMWSPQGGKDYKVLWTETLQVVVN